MRNNKKLVSWISSLNKEKWLKGRILLLLIIKILSMKRLSSISIGKHKRSRTWIIRMLLNIESRLVTLKSEERKFLILSSIGINVDYLTNYWLLFKKDNILSLSLFKHKLYLSSCREEMWLVLLKLGQEKRFHIFYQHWSMWCLKDLSKKVRDQLLSLWHQQDNWLVKFIWRLNILLNRQL